MQVHAVLRCWFDWHEKAHAPFLFSPTQIDVIVGGEHRSETVVQLDGPVVGSSLLDDAALASSVGFTGNVRQNGATVRIRSTRSTTFSVRPQGHALTISAFLQFCARGATASNSGPPVPATTTMRLATIDGGFYSLASTPGASSQISSNARCFTAHAVISSITANLDVVFIDVEFSSPLANTSLVACNDASLVRLANDSCVSPQRDPNTLTYLPVSANQTVFVFSTEAQDHSLQFATLEDIVPPVFTLCPRNRTVVAPPSSLMVQVNWTLPEATDGVELATMILNLASTTISGNTVSRLFSVARSIYNAEYTAIDTSNNRQSCRSVLERVTWCVIDSHAHSVFFYCFVSGSKSASRQALS
jgi:hypothetical protein